MIRRVSQSAKIELYSVQTKLTRQVTLTRIRDIVALNRQRRTSQIANLLQSLYHVVLYQTLLESNVKTHTAQVINGRKETKSLAPEQLRLVGHAIHAPTLPVTRTFRPISTNWTDLVKLSFRPSHRQTFASDHGDLKLLEELRHLRSLANKHIGTARLRNDLIGRVSFLTHRK